MHPASSSNPEQCTSRSDARAKHRWLINNINQIDHYEDVESPIINQGGEEDIEADTGRTTMKPNCTHEILPSDSGL